MEVLEQRHALHKESTASRGAAVRIRREFAGKLRGLLRRGPTWLAVMHLVLHAGLAVGAAALTAWVLRRDAVLGWVLYPVTAIFIATRLRALGNMLHEASHFALVGDRDANIKLGHLLAILDFSSYDLYTRDHITHHVHLGDPEKDLDFAPRRRFGFDDPSSPFVLKHLLLPLTLFHVPSYLRPIFFRREDGRVVQLGRAAWLAILVGTGVVAGGWNLLLFFVIPYLTSYQVLRYWSDALDHAGIITDPEELYRARNHVLPGRFLNWLIFPRNDEYHLVHHLFPGVPTRSQPAVHRLLLSDPEYAGLEHRFTGFFTSGRVPSNVIPLRSSSTQERRRSGDA